LVGRDLFIEGRNLIPETGTYEFRIIKNIKRLPSAAELVNELDGCPLPIPGADVVFARGIRTTTDRGAVGTISGASGTGKTTLALSIAASLAPMGVTTFYLSCEEDAVDLEKRIYTLTPPFIRRTATFPRDVGDWFYAQHLDRPDPENNRDGAIHFIEDLKQVYAEAGIRPASDAPPGILPLLVVFDGIHELIHRDSGTDQVVNIRNLVDRFRELGALVLILAADNDEPALRELDYTVDFVIRLEIAAQVDPSEGPLRKFILVKTRLQYSRPGSHILHISKREGVKIYPYLSAQLDTFSNFAWKTPDAERWYDFLLTGFGAKESSHLVRIYERSQVLVCGRGSAGKAGFALRLLMASLETTEPEEHSLFLGDQAVALFHNVGPSIRPFRDPRRILIVSFLYEEDYYRNLRDSIVKRNLDSDSLRKRPRPNIELDVLSLYPGYLPPEVLVAKIIGQLEKRSSQGTSYSGVIVDGLHNVFLHFPKLQDSIMVWPTLFETFRVYGLTVVTTHSLFEIRGMDSGIQFRADVHTATQRVGPLLQAIVNSADFYLDISPSATGGNAGLYPIEVVTAMGQEAKGRSNYFWNRERSIVMLQYPGPS